MTHLRQPVTMARFLPIVFVTGLLQVAWGFDTYKNVNSDSLGIYGGHEISIQDVPFMAEIAIKNRGGAYSVCGGSIIHEKFILTAAHCFKKAIIPISIWGILGGDHFDDKDAVHFHVINKLCHKDYTPSNGRFQIPSYNDICLLKMKKSLTFGRKVAPVMLPLNFHFEDGVLANVTGWGRSETSNMNYFKGVRQVTIPIQSQESCLENYPAMIDSQLCAGSLGHGPCKGDSGGPLTINNVQVGVDSGGMGCGGSYGKLFTRLSSYIDWIHATIAENLP